MSNPMERALAALKYHTEQTRAIQRSNDAIAALEEAIKQQGDPIGYFCDVNTLMPEQGKRIEQVCESAKDDQDVFPLFISAPTIPKGWKLVPVEPTPEMINAAMSRYKHTSDSAAEYFNELHQGNFKYDFLAMLAASPEYKP